MNKELLLRCFYPFTRTLINNRSLVYSFYRNQCFDTTKQIVKESKELKDYQLTYPILSAIDVLEKHPDDFLIDNFDRFVFEKDKKHIFSMINIYKNQDGKTTLIRL